MSAQNNVVIAHLVEGLYISLCRFSQLFNQVFLKRKVIILIKWYRKVVISFLCNIKDDFAVNNGLTTTA